MAVKSVLSAGILSLTLGVALTGTLSAPARANSVIELTQSACQFVEPEGGNHGYTTTQKADCLKINRAAGAERLAGAAVMELQAGTHTFRVANQNVPYEVGFWLREADYDWRNPLHKVEKISVSGGGLFEGQSKDFTVELKPGEYIYSCPLNPTLNYKVVVK